MKNIPKKHIVVLGAGFGGTYTMKALHKQFHGRDDIEITLVNDTNYFLFTPLLHEVATGALHPDNVVEPIRKVITCCLKDLIVTSVSHVSFKDKVVHTTSGKISYDYLVMALGAETNFFNIPGAEEHSFTLKSMDDAMAIKRQFIRSLEEATDITDKEERQKLLTFTIIGGGPTGIELAAETAEFFYHTFAKYYPKELIDEVRICVIQRGETILQQFSPVLQKKALTILKKKKVEILLNHAVEKVDSNSVYITGGKKIYTKTPIWVAGVKPTNVTIDKEGLQNSRGCFVVNQGLQLLNDPHVYVIGDMAHCEDPITKKGLPALAQVAVQQGVFVAKNIKRHIEGKDPIPLKIKLRGMLVSLGEWRAAGQVGALHFTGRIAWWMWRTIYLTKLLSWKKKFQVAADWTIQLFTSRDISDV